LKQSGHIKRISVISNSYGKTIRIEHSVTQGKYTLKLCLNYIDINRIKTNVVLAMFLISLNAFSLKEGVFDILNKLYSIKHMIYEF
jgi:hypothetical protein